MAGLANIGIKIYVGGLDFSFGESQIQEIFEAFGPLDAVSAAAVDKRSELLSPRPRCHTGRRRHAPSGQMKFRV